MRVNADLDLGAWSTGRLNASVNPLEGFRTRSLCYVDRDSREQETRSSGVETLR